MLKDEMMGDRGIANCKIVRKRRKNTLKKDHQVMFSSNRSGIGGDPETGGMEEGKFFKKKKSALMEQERQLERQFNRQRKVS